MGYRSNGKLYLTMEAYELLPEKLKDELADDWDTEQHPTLDEGGTWAFYDWKWYSTYDDVKAWESFFDELDEHENRNTMYDFIVIGEDGAIVEERTGCMFYASTTIGTYS